MERREWFVVGEGRGTGYLVVLENGREELRFHHLAHKVTREGLDVLIHDTEGVILIQRLLSSDDKAAETGNPENPEEVAEAMKEVDRFMRSFEAIREIRQTDDTHIVIKSQDDLLEDKYVMKK